MERAHPEQAGVIPAFGERRTGVDYRLRPGGYAVIDDGGGRVAAVETPEGLFLPGGGQEGAEGAEAAAVREAFEECGLRIRVRRALGVADEFAWCASEGAHFRKRCAFFEAEVLAAEGGGEADHRLVWLPRAEAAERLTHASQRWACERQARDQRMR